MHSPAVETFRQIMDEVATCPYCGEPIRPGEWIATVHLVRIASDSSQYPVVSSQDGPSPSPSSLTTDYRPLTTDYRPLTTVKVPIHRECMLRQIVGSVGHQLGTCSCHGGEGPCDPPGMTVREAARAAADLFRERRGG
jgi:hypothetical protein